MLKLQPFSLRSKRCASRLTKTHLPSSLLSALMLCVALTLNACGVNPGPNLANNLAPAEPPKLSPAPAWMQEPCPKLGRLPDQALAQKAVEDQWRDDVRAYEECRTKHAALKQFYRNRDARLRAKLEK